MVFVIFLYRFVEANLTMSLENLCLLTLCIHAQYTSTEDLHDPVLKVVRTMLVSAP